MANKNTKRAIKAAKATLPNKGACVASGRDGKWRPNLSKEQQNAVEAIRQQTLEVYHRSAG